MKSGINEVIRMLRKKTGDSQQAFATRLKLSIRSVANYEKNRMPAPTSLAAMANLARRIGEHDLAEALWSAMPAELAHYLMLRSEAKR